MVGHDPGGERYSTLTQITPKNVRDLKIAWVYHMKPATKVDASHADANHSYSGAGLHQSEDQPLVIGQTMYVVTPYSRVVALDSSTGQEKWVFEIPDGDNASLRGAAYWPGEGGSGAAIIFGTRRGRMYSISAATGHLNAGFGVNGMVDLKTPEVMRTGMDKSYILPSPPTIYKNLIITGAGPGEGPGGKDGGLGPAGDTRAWDAKTGKLVWTFHSVPLPGETGHETWAGDSWKNRSGVNVWGYMTVDVERGILYMPFGAPNNDRVGVDRPGDNLFGSSLVAVNADTGKLLWYFQVVHHDIWDVDTESPPTLFDVRRGSEIIPAVATVNKNGLMFILNRVTGKPIYDVDRTAGSEEQRARRADVTDAAFSRPAGAALAGHAKPRRISTRTRPSTRRGARSTSTTTICCWARCNTHRLNSTATPSPCPARREASITTAEPSIRSPASSSSTSTISRSPCGSFASRMGVISTPARSQVSNASGILPITCPARRLPGDNWSQ